jgi:transcription-repair coupling factor (superfamily II helicase)
VTSAILGQGENKLRKIVEYLAHTQEVMALEQAMSTNGGQQLVTGISGSARHLLYAALKKDARSILIVTHSMTNAEAVVADLSELLGENQVYLFPERELTHDDLLAFSPELAALRLRTLQALKNQEKAIYVTTIRGLKQPMVTPQRLFQAVAQLVWGSIVPMDQLLVQLIAGGYERVERVETRGQFSVRGGLLDVYPLNADAVRIEWFGDEVDSIRLFDPETQRSTEQVKSIEIWPAREMVVSASELKDLGDRVENEMIAFLNSHQHHQEFISQMRHHIGRDVERMKEGMHFPSLIRYAGWLADYDSSALRYFPANAWVFYDEPMRLRETIERVIREEAEWMTGALERGEILPGLLNSYDIDQIFQCEGRPQMYVSLFPRHVLGIHVKQTINLTMHSMQRFHGQMPLLKSELTRYKKTNQHIVILAASAERADRLIRVLEDFSIELERRPHFDANAELPMVIIGNLSAGFELPQAHLVVISESEIFVTKKRARRVRDDAPEAARIKSYQDLRVGDCVVHVSHGIGRYLGVETLEVGGLHRDYLHLQYAGNDKLYVPVDQINLVQKFLGNEEREPRLNHLGGSEWVRTKRKVQKSVQDIAEDLIKIYAEREAQPGHSFRGDTEWQRDFEAMFPYEETPDQLRAVTDIKKDMEKTRAMDRLLCGDVGYGKTEVAIRAAAKAVFDGKQVAVLVPTTILAQQHYATFSERFSGFPVRVEMVSRFRSKTEVNKGVEGLRTGAVDIVIGTHRLLNKSIQFKDLGLLIVDEEQRFGVSHKEKLKQLKSSIDCLTLTATPIPRTLHMSMVGVRDLSVIETPPENRFPVQTYVLEYSDTLLQEAIERELSRGGQVYVLYNQVQGIQSIAERIVRMVPEARVAVGHGQMPESQLEQVMLDFLQGETDVLVSTTIIETGIDIPNVNTLVVFYADRLGLSQLYQLRGRVGRSNRIAYAYFTYQPDKVLTEVAEKRLQAIKEFTELGSGFKIAMRDLSIRGAGNLLGAEQHGFISAVGFDMYSDMLADAIQGLKGEKKEVKPEPNVEITVDAYLPQAYIPNEAQKIEVYQKFVACRSLHHVADLREELQDRFGDPPQEVENLLSVASLRAYAYQYDLESFYKQDNDLHIVFRPEVTANLSGPKLFQMTQLYPKRMHLKATGGRYTLVIEGRRIKDEELLQMALKVMKELTSVFIELKEDFENVH